MLLQTIMPIYYDSGNSNMTPEESAQFAKVMLGIWIVCNMIWATTWLFHICRYHIKYKGKHPQMPTKFFDDYYGTCRMEFQPLFDTSMFVTWGIIILIALGCWVASYL